MISGNGLASSVFETACDFLAQSEVQSRTQMRAADSANHLL